MAGVTRPISMNFITTSFETLRRVSFVIESLTVGDVFFSGIFFCFLNEAPPPVEEGQFITIAAEAQGSGITC